MFRQFAYFWCYFSILTEGAVRLVGGAFNGEGRVEVYHNNSWGTVCDDDWSITDANVVCQQLNYSQAISALGLASFGEGSGPIHYDNVACNGTEARLADCSHSGIGIHNCAHDQDAGVVCGMRGQSAADYVYLCGIEPIGNANIHASK